MTGNLAFDSSDSGALPGRSTTTVYTSAWVAASASVGVHSQQGQFDICDRMNVRGHVINRKVKGRQCFESHVQRNICLC